MLEYFDLLVENFDERGANEKELYDNYSKKISSALIVDTSVRSRLYSVMLEYFDLLVQNFDDRDENEEELYDNYSKNISRCTISRCLSQNFLSGRMREKDNRKAKEYHELAQDAYDNQEYAKSIRLFTKSLNYAKYNSQDFTKALISRIIVSYVVGDYKSCIQDKKWLQSSALEEGLERKVNTLIEKCLENLAESSDNSNSKNKEVQDLGPLNCHSLNFASERLSVTANNPIMPGDTIFVSKPYSWAPNFCDDITVNSYCQNCFLWTEILLPCKMCVEFGYCSEKCQYEAWTNFHQWECFGIRAGFFKLSEFQLPALRVLFKALEVNFDTDPLLHIPTHFQIRDNLQLAEAASIALVTITYLKEKFNFFETLKAVPKFLNLTEEEAVSKIGGMYIGNYLKLLSHMVDVQTIMVERLPKMVTYACTICPVFSKFKHSCKPNTAVYFEDGVMHVKAVKNIAKDEEILVSQRNVSVLERNFEERRKAILRYMGVFCTCSACRFYKINELYVCPKCNEGSALPDDCDVVSLCLHCDHVFNISKKYKEHKTIIEKNMKMYDIVGNVELLNQSYQMGIQIFGLKSISLLQIYDKLIRHYMNTDNHGKFLEMITESFPSREAIHGKMSVQLGMDLHFHTAYILQFVRSKQTGAQMEPYKALVECAVIYIKKLKSLFEVIHKPFVKTIEAMEKSADKLTACLLENR